jgi:hypothetical protein
MHRTAPVLNVLLFAAASISLLGACSKSEATTSAPGEQLKGSGGHEIINVPTSGGPGGMRSKDPLADSTIGAKGGGTPTKEDNTKLTPEEGALTIEAPADCKAGASSTAKVRLVPNTGYDVNLKYPFKLNLTAPDGVTLDKAALRGGGHDGAGDAETLELRQMSVPVKLVAAKPGDYSINGMFEFAICKEDACITKHVPVALKIAAK